MAGEYSKKSGEYGEKIVFEILKLIGWGNADLNPTIKCISEEHNRKSKTHGLDFVFSLESPLINYVQDDVLISVKHHAEGYPSGIVSKFKNHLTDLATSMDCFSYDDTYAVKRVSNQIRERHTSGVLFWITSKNDLDRNLFEEITQFRNPEKPDFGPIYLVDNKRASFLYNAINFAKKYYTRFKFHYHSTGYNDNNPTLKEYNGNILPVQLINTNLLTIRVEDSKDGPTLLLFVNESFSSPSLQRVMGFSHRITSSWAKAIIILYPDYLELTHLNDVQSVKRLFQSEEFIQTVQVKSFIENVSTLGSE